MRIIAGQYRGRRLTAPPGQDTRPMLDRVREAMFGTLAPWVEGARVLDLFAGSGALGLEALSRGAEYARFVERARNAVTVLRHNLAELEVGPAAEVVCGGALSPESWRFGTLGDDRRWDLIFFDPPYPWLRISDRRVALFAAVKALVTEHLAADGVLVFHTPKHGVAPGDFARGLELERRVYGTTALWYVEAGTVAAESVRAEAAPAEAAESEAKSGSEQATELEA